LTEEKFLKKTEGSPIRRLGYNRWLRNIAIGIGIGIGSSPPAIENIEALKAKQHIEDAALQEHIEWALERQCSI